MTEELKDALRRIVYHTCKMWDASVEAESLLGDDAEICCNDAEFVAAGIDNADTAMTLSERDLADVFNIEETAR